MKEQSATQEPETGGPVKLVPAQTLVDRTNEIRDMIVRRAYELFESRDYVHGQDINDWLQAESELLHPYRHEMKESSEAIIHHAEVPGSFSPEQLTIGVEPRSLIVSGETELNVLCGDSKGTHTERKPRHIFRVHDLPIDTYPSRTTATLKNELLEVVNTAAPPLAGVFHMALPRFLLFDALGASFWVGSFVALGFVFSDGLEKIATYALRLGLLLLVFLIAGLAGYILWKYTQRRRFLRELRIARISPEDLKHKLDSGENIVIVDLRHSLDFEADPRTLPGAIRMDPHEVAQQIHEIPCDRDVVHYCT